MTLRERMKLKMAEMSAEIPLGACPECGNKVDRARAVNEPGIFQSPVEGDTTVCGQCFAWLLFRGDLSMRKMTSADIKSLTTEERGALVELSRAIMRVNELSANRPKVR